MFKIYVDMDSVLCDFDKRYRELFGFISKEYSEWDRNNKADSKRWTQFVETRQFETLDWFEGGQSLISILNTLKYPKYILSSTGGQKYNKEVAEQKEVWLKNHNIDYPRFFVPGRKYKAEYADKNSILIDDTKEVIQYFNEAGGNGILHISLDRTLDQLSTLLNM